MIIISFYMTDLDICGAIAPHYKHVVAVVVYGCDKNLFIGALNPRLRQKFRSLRTLRYKLVNLFQYGTQRYGEGG